MNKLNIELSKEEAIVLFEYLGRLNKSDDSTTFEDQAEQRVLWNIECVLEKELNEPLQDDYQEILKNAKAAVRDAK